MIDVYLEFADRYEDVQVKLPAVPRIGEVLLWTEEITDGEGPHDESTEYQVLSVNWAVSSPGMPEPDAGEGIVTVRLEPVPTGDAASRAWQHALSEHTATREQRNPPVRPLHVDPLLITPRGY